MSFLEINLPVTEILCQVCTCFYQHSMLGIYPRKSLWVYTTWLRTSKAILFTHAQEKLEATSVPTCEGSVMSAGEWGAAPRCGHSHPAEGPCAASYPTLPSRWTSYPDNPACVPKGVSMSSLSPGYWLGWPLEGMGKKQRVGKIM